MSSLARQSYGTQSGPSCHDQMKDSSSARCAVVGESEEDEGGGGGVEEGGGGAEEGGEGGERGKGTGAAALGLGSAMRRGSQVKRNRERESNRISVKRTCPSGKVRVSPSTSSNESHNIKTR